MIVRDRELEAPDDGIETRTLRAAGAARRDVRVADDEPHLDERGVPFEPVALEYRLERAVTALVGVLRPPHVEGVAIQCRGVGVCGHELELGLGVDEPPDEPGTGGAVDVEVAPRDPPHRIRSLVLDASSMNPDSSSSQEASSSSTRSSPSAPK